MTGYWGLILRRKRIVQLFRCVWNTTAKKCMSGLAPPIIVRSDDDKRKKNVFYFEEI